MFCSEEMYSDRELLDLYNLYIKNNRSPALALREYVQNFPNRPVPNKKIFIRIDLSLQRHGCLRSKKRNKSRNVLTEATQLEILLFFQENPEQSLTDAERRLGVARTTIHKCLVLNKYRPWKFRPLQKLTDDHKRSRLEFCGTLLQDHLENNIFNKILWSDESYFSTAGMYNRKNKHFWSSENHHVFREVRKQGRKSVNVWCGILGRRIIGPYFFEGSMNAVKYQELLETFLLPILDDLPLAIRRDVIFQHDGAPYHHSDGITNFMAANFQQFIGARGTIPWPACSPDLTPMDFFLWGALKNQIYNRNEHLTIESIKQQIRDHINYLNTTYVVASAINHLTTRYTTCVFQDGGHVENLL